MQGTNPKRLSIHGDGNLLEVKNIFKTIQGEGPFAGLPAIFIRLGGCNLACRFCDTDFENFKTFSLQAIIEQVIQMSHNLSKENIINLVVITGGEPFRQPIEKLCSELLKSGFTVQIETNGTLYRELPEEVYIICSPKPGKNGYYPIREDLLSKVKAIKFLIAESLPQYNRVAEVGQSKYNIPTFIQPIDQSNDILNLQNTQLAIALAMEKGYRLSIQLHKILNIE